ncbi:MAG: GNAT family N-acetyltransferase [Acidimicrobiia bacterium]|nr:GNAT family N-acetyltransferase [Acidimicrobiia bacterium]
MTVRLELVTQENVRAVCALELKPGQEKHVAPNAISLAQAYVSERAWPRAILSDDELVGFVMVALPTDDDPVWYLWRLMVAADQQGKGYGGAAVRAVMEEARSQGATELFVSWVPPDEGGPERFYLDLGFEPTGEVHGGEIEGKAAL